MQIDGDDRVIVLPVIVVQGAAKSGHQSEKQIGSEAQIPIQAGLFFTVFALFVVGQLRPCLRRRVCRIVTFPIVFDKALFETLLEPFLSYQDESEQNDSCSQYDLA